MFGGEKSAEKIISFKLLMSFQEDILNIPLREKSGPTIANRYDFQKDCGICKLIEYYNSGKDFIILFDWHEDIIVMDSEADPQKISFYQVKGKSSGNWSIKDLLRREKSQDKKELLSILGKLYDCKIKFKDKAESLNFISNARFNITLDKGSSLSKDEICLNELPIKDKDKILNQIKDEHLLKQDPEINDITFLKVVDLSLNESSVHTQGKISEFLEQLKPLGKFNIPAVYKMLFSEVRRRTNYNKENISYEDLISKKSISKTKFIEILSATGVTKDYDQIWERITQEMNICNVSFLDKKNIKRAWTQVEIELMNPNDILRQYGIYIKKIYKELEDKGKMKDKNLIECLEIIFTEFVNKFHTREIYDSNFIKALILSEIYE